MQIGLKAMLSVLAGCCLLWFLVVPWVYILKRDPVALEFWPFTGAGAILSVAYAIWALVILPCVLIGSTWWSRRAFAEWHALWIVSGIAVGMWCNTVYITLPYLGVYPSVMSAAIATVIFGRASYEPKYIDGVLWVNVVIWSIVGIVVASWSAYTDSPSRKPL